MTDTLLALVPQHGPLVLFLATFLSCLALPIPSSILMLAAGAFVASGDLAAATVVAAALGGALIGDQAGYGLGRVGGGGFWQRLLDSPRSGAIARRAGSALRQRVFPTVYLSRWLFSALGPYVNFAAGAARVGWPGFSVASLLGEATWVGLYVGLGFLFAARIETLGATVSSAIGALAAAVVALLLGRMIWRNRRKKAA
jgi:membrane protein DedA with SNARE-associated domain